MTKRHDFQLLAASADIVAAPAILAASIPAQRACTDRSFELPTALYVATIGLYRAFLAIMAVGFQSPEMILPMVIFVAFIAMLFGTPALWARMKPDHDSRALTMAQFMACGIDTHTGHNKGGAAAIQMLILPVLVLCWGIAVVVIAALV